jgi:hypothetical protein
MGTICGTLTQAQTGCPVVDGTSYWLGPEQKGMLEQHSLADNTVLATFGVVPSAEGITIIGPTTHIVSSSAA